MQQYHQLLKDVLNNGTRREDRTGTGTISLFGPQAIYDLQEGFPLVTTKKVFWRGVVHELFWFLSGSTSVVPLQAADVHIWDVWATQGGELGPVYGKQWRSWHHEDGDIDQIRNLMIGLQHNPFSRRHIVSAWNVGDLDDMALPPCHLLFQFYVREEGPDPKCFTCLGDGVNMFSSVSPNEPCSCIKKYLDCKLYQRSADLFLGVPFNIASYALLTHMIAEVCGFEPGRFIHSFGDAHIYVNHLDQVEKQLLRECKPLPSLKIIREPKFLDDISTSDIILEGYRPHKRISAPIAI